MFGNQRTKIWLSIGLGGLLTAIVAYEWLVPQFWLEAAIPPLATGFLLWLARIGYFWQRRVSYARREARRQAVPAEPIQIPAGIKKPEEYEGVDALHLAQGRHHRHAVDAQGSYFANGILAALLPPLALVMLSLQLLLFREGGAWAGGLILGEILCLGLFVHFAWTHPEPTAEWIENRVRTELLRREQYLAVVGVGPYLCKTAAEAKREAAVRLGKIKGAAGQTLNRLILAQDGTHEHWLEGLHKTGVSKFSARSDLVLRFTKT